MKDLQRVITATALAVVVGAAGIGFALDWSTRLHDTLLAAAIIICFRLMKTKPKQTEDDFDGTLRRVAAASYAQGLAHGIEKRRQADEMPPVSGIHNTVQQLPYVG